MTKRGDNFEKNVVFFIVTENDLIHYLLHNLFYSI